MGRHVSYIGHADQFVDRSNNRPMKRTLWNGRFAMEGGDVDCRYEDSYERPWTVAMGGPDNSWAEPGLGTNPLNYALAFCDIIGEALC